MNVENHGSLLISQSGYKKACEISVEMMTIEYNLKLHFSNLNVARGNALEECEHQTKEE